MVEELTIVYDEYFASVEEEPEGKLENLPDTFLFRNVLNGLAGSEIHFEKLNVDAQHCFLFSGPGGTGRHTLANAFIQTVCGNDYSFDYSCKLILGAEDFMEAGIASTGEIAEHVEAIFQCAKAYAQKGNVFLIFDEMESYPNLLRLTTALANAFEEFEDRRIYLILITEGHDGFSHDLLNKAFLCRCNKPNKRQREKYLASRLKWNVADWEDPDSGMVRTVTVRFSGSDYADIAEQTEGFAYRDLSWLVFSLRAEAALRLKLSTMDADIYVDVDKDTVENYVDSYRDTSGANTIAFAPFGNFAMSMNPGNGYGMGNETNRPVKKNVDEMSFEEQMDLIRNVVPITEDN